MVDIVVTDVSQASHVGHLSGSGNRCLDISCGGLDSLVQGLGPVGNVNIYVSHVPDSQAWEIDALNVSGEGLVSYVQWPSSLR